MNKLQAAQKKAEWLTYCLSIGFEKSQIDTLSAIWDQFKDEYGNLRPADESPLPAESGEQEAMWKQIISAIHKGEHISKLTSQYTITRKP